MHTRASTGNNNRSLMRAASGRTLRTIHLAILTMLVCQAPASLPADTLLPGLALDSCGNLHIANIELFLDTCPASDPALAEIRSDFQIRRNGVLVGNIACSEPVSQLPLSQYTNELIALQGLRTIYYMDRGRSGHLPWTPGTMYDWMKTRIQGINIVDGTLGGFCCDHFDGRTYFRVPPEPDDFNRNFDRKWEGISGNIGLYAHETRHIDGFGHTSCCGISGGCDQAYDESSLSAYGIQHWLDKSWLMGDLNVGFACLSQSRVHDIANWHLISANDSISRFCTNKPPTLAMPQFPGGQCQQPGMGRPPNAICRDVTTSAVASCEASVAEAEVDDGSRDPDGDPIGLCLRPAGPYPVGTTTVTLTVADSHSNTSHCSATVTVLDTLHLQADADHDGIGDACDQCTDTDDDGLGDPEFPANKCALDNCPTISNPLQEDDDRDEIGDACDPCPHDPHNDLDGDGVCHEIDNCPSAANPEQRDTDRDGFGDVCDDCPENADSSQTDLDSDGIGDACDDCPAVSNHDQHDADGDARGDVCDNCPDAVNSDQTDSNQDGSGDACQPTLTVSGISRLSSGVLELRALATDPQNDPLSGSLEFLAIPPTELLLHDPAPSPPSCDIETILSASAGEGIGYAFASVGYPVLFDLDGVFACSDFYPDFLLAKGRCEHPDGFFTTILDLTGVQTPAPICVERIADPEHKVDLSVLEFNTTTLLAAPGMVTTDLRIPFTGGLPRSSDISSLAPGHTYRLVVTLTDGSTHPVGAAVSFVSGGEPILIVNNPPQAVIDGGRVVECRRVPGDPVVLDASRSSDPDAGDQVVSFDWFENFGLPTEALLGSERALAVTLPVGEHVVTLRVADSVGEANTTSAEVTVIDTTPPVLTVVPDHTVLWPPNHTLLPVHVNIQAIDACDAAPAVILISATSSELDDAEGDGDGNTTGDVAGGDFGSPDTDLLLRSERAGSGPGRTYQVLYSARDASGNTSSALGLVTVQHAGSDPEPLLMNLEWSGQPSRLHIFWNDAPGATGYDLIAGDLGEVSLNGKSVSLGAVRGLSIGLRETSFVESAAVVPELGKAIFYLLQYHDSQGAATGYGTESVPWPREPSSCSGGC